MTTVTLDVMNPTKRWTRINRDLRLRMSRGNAVQITVHDQTHPAVVQALIRCVVLGVLLCACPTVRADDSGLTNDAGEFFDMELSALMDIDVTSVAGVAHPWFTTPAAMYVLNAEDIRRGGHTSIPEALRMVPGVHVARSDSRRWAVTARGFSDIWANKLLVRMDGRTIYEPVYSGVNWDQHDMVLADLDRIEVVRGPGATLWGANAVNGVINITSKSAKDTQGFYFSGIAGTEEQANISLRYGGQMTDSAWFRIWGKYAARDNFEEPVGHGQFHDDWDVSRSGVRFDFEGSDGITATLEAGVGTSNRLAEDFRLPVTGGHFTFASVRSDGQFTDAHVLGRIIHQADDGDGWEAQAYYEYSNRREPAGVGQKRSTVDLDFRHHFKALDVHEVVWGVGWHYDRTQLDGTSLTFSVNGEYREADKASAFIQDTITLVPDHWFMMVGSKFEYNDFTGFEYQPSARVWWTPNKNRTVWAAVSRPVRTPTLAEDDVFHTAFIADPGLPPLGAGGPFGSIAFGVSPDRDVESEELTSLEAGYRQRFAKDITIDIAGFVNFYRKLLVAPGGSGGSFTWSNIGTAKSQGVEVALTWDIQKNWRVVGTYSFINIDVEGPSNDNPEGNTPKNLLSFRSEYDVSKDIELNVTLYYADRRVPQPGAQATSSNSNTNSYWRLDTGITWRPTENLEIAVWGQNLLDRNHREWLDTGFATGPAEVERGVYAELTCRF